MIQILPRSARITAQHTLQISTIAPLRQSKTIKINHIALHNEII
jgi:hypothetical protein